jgi:hypothetical protein
MSSKDKIREAYPRAYAEKYKTNGVVGNKESYYLIWSSRIRADQLRLGEGLTEAKAWKDALYWIDNK